jgi:hypothetical protein
MKYISGWEHEVESDTSSKYKRRGLQVALPMMLASILVHHVQSLRENGHMLFLRLCSLCCWWRGLVITRSHRCHHLLKCTITGMTSNSNPTAVTTFLPQSAITLFLWQGMGTPGLKSSVFRNTAVRVSNPTLRHRAETSVITSFNDMFRW